MRRIQPLRVHWLQHAVHEGLGCIGPWLKKRRYSVGHTRLYSGEALPGPDEFDWLIVMGGPMNIYQYVQYPWLLKEKEFINDAIVNNKKVLGICLGSQLIADVLGGPVNKNNNAEIGFFDLHLTEDASATGALAILPRRFSGFHWHGDTFAIPPGARNFYESDACVNQAFSWGLRVYGLQFHLEVTHSDAKTWLELEQPTPAPYVQSKGKILKEPARFEMNNRLMVQVLEQLASL